jgi:hypothetical protein
VLTRTLKDTSLCETTSFEPLCVKIGQVVWFVEKFERKKAIAKYIQPMMLNFTCQKGRPTLNLFQPFLESQEIVPTLSIQQTFILISQGVLPGISLTVIRIYCFHRKAGSSLTLCLALTRLHVINKNNNLQQYSKASTLQRILKH